MSGTFRFATPWVLSLLLLIPLLFLIRAWLRQSGKPAAMRFAVADMAQGLPGSWRIRFRPITTLLRAVAIGMIIIGLARPQIGNAQETITGEGIEIALALDISGSMASLDFQPANRLEASKAVISDFISQRPYDKVGLAIFAAEAFNQSPLTLDHNMLNRSLDQIELAPELGLDDGTAIGLGLANAANMLAGSDAASKIVILLTDGVNNSGQIDPMTAAEAAKALGIKVYTIGAGKTGQVPVPVKSMFGTEQIMYQESQIDEATLQQIADITGGQFFRAEDSDTLGQIYDEISELEKSQVEVQIFNKYEEKAAWILLPALMLIALELILRQTLFRTIP
ncbi:MAG: VWA domain-containing protein [Anaerolineae bacterium]|nr:VWA domain-containing protein [Anaerolineae bacterium]